MALGKKTGGRTSGTLNKSTEKFRSMVEKLLTDNWDDITEAFGMLSPKEKLKATSDLLPFVCEKAKAFDPTDNLPHNREMTIDDKINAVLGINSKN